MTNAAHVAADPHRASGEATEAGQALVKRMATLQEPAKHTDLRRAAGDLMGMTD